MSQQLKDKLCTMLYDVQQTNCELKTASQELLNCQNKKPLTQIFTDVERQYGQDQAKLIAAIDNAQRIKNQQDQKLQNVKLRLCLLRREMSLQKYKDAYDKHSSVYGKMTLASTFEPVAEEDNSEPGNDDVLD